MRLLPLWVGLNLRSACRRICLNVENVVMLSILVSLVYTNATAIIYTARAQAEILPQVESAITRRMLEDHVAWSNRVSSDTNVKIDHLTVKVENMENAMTTVRVRQEYILASIDKFFYAIAAIGVAVIGQIASIVYSRLFPKA